MCLFLKCAPFCFGSALCPSIMMSQARDGRYRSDRKCNRQFPIGDDGGKLMVMAGWWRNLFLSITTLAYFVFANLVLTVKHVLGQFSFFCLLVKSDRLEQTCNKFLWGFGIRFLTACSRSTKLPNDPETYWLNLHLILCYMSCLMWHWYVLTLDRVAGCTCYRASFLYWPWLDRGRFMTKLFQQFLWPIAKWHPNTCFGNDLLVIWQVLLYSYLSQLTFDLLRYCWQTYKHLK